MNRKTKNTLIAAAAVTAIAVPLGGHLVQNNNTAIISHGSSTQSGDVNGDGTFNIADLVSMQDFLLGRGTLNDWKAGDLCEDDRIDVFDLVLMRRKLISSSQQSENTIVTTITFNGTSVTLTDENDAVITAENAQNVSVSDATYVTITMPGTYSVYGECNNAQIVVDVDKELYTDGKVELELNGVTLSNDSDSPIYVRSIKKECIITAKKNTVNTISDGSDYQNEDESAGAIYAKDDLKFKGKGELIVNGNCKFGILSKNNIKIWNSTLTVNSVDVGIKGKDSVRIGDPDADDYSDLVLTVNAENGDGIKSTETDDTSDGFVRINGGTVKVKSYSDCIQASNNIEINGGDIDLYAYEGGDYTGTGSSGNTGNPGGWGGFGGFNPGGGGMNDGNSNKTEDSAKGLKSDGDLTINAGTLNIDTSDDALHCAGTLTVKDGNITISTADDGLHSDNYLVIDGGDIRINKSYEGIEGASITVNDGTIHVVSSDDGFNAAGNKTSLISYTLVFNGGYTFVRNGGDGIDSNGTTEINGGTILVAGPEGGGDSPLDSEYGITYNGGIVMAVGSSQAMWREDIVGNIDGDYWVNTS
ncbi:MAG: carbohydrate-binding domain-containing protein, partial [Ruminococcus sp.]|nr:carbohydrate-binding domain-containing protein [Ruminococcus sp.]